MSLYPPPKRNKTMKITKEQLKELIKEEIDEALAPAGSVKLRAVSDVFINAAGYISVDVEHEDWLNRGADTISLTGKLSPESIEELKEDGFLE